MMNAESIINGTGMLLQAYAQRQAKQEQLQKPVKVSIIVPVYNAMPYFTECMRSLMAQTLEDIELIVVDDGGRDGSGTFADALAEVNDAVRVIHQKNVGVSAARNAGLAIARGEYVGFVDADDFIDPELFETLYEAAVLSSAEIVNSGYTTFGTKESSSTSTAPSFEPGKVLGHEDMKRHAAQMHKTGCFLFVWRNLFSRSFLEENHIRFDEDITVGEDTLFCMECFLKAQRVVSVDIDAYRYRIHSGSAMRQQDKSLLESSLQNQFTRKLALAEQYLGAYQGAFLRDMAEYNITVLFPLMLANLYQNDMQKKGQEFKRLVNSDMMQKAFADFDLAEIRSKSLDWRMFLLAKKKRYFAAHMICKFVLYKNQETARH